MNRRPPLQHPLAALFQGAAQSLTASLNQETIRFYYCIIRNFLNFLGAQYPQVQITESRRVHTKSRPRTRSTLRQSLVYV